MRRLLGAVACAVVAWTGWAQQPMPLLSGQMWRDWTDTHFLPGYAFPYHSLDVTQMLWTPHPWSWAHYLEQWLLPLSDTAVFSDSLYTRLAYFQGERELQFFDAAHYQQRKKGWGFFQYRRLYTATYYAHRTTRRRSLAGGGGIDGRHYRGSFRLRWKDAAWEENGGIAEPALLSQVSLFQYPALPVRLSTASQSLRLGDVEWRGRWQRAIVNDSDSVVGGAPWGIVHAIRAGLTAYGYADPQAFGADYYPVQDTASIGKDSIASYYLYGRVGAFYQQPGGPWSVEGGLEAEGGRAFQPLQGGKAASQRWNAYLRAGWHHRGWQLSFLMRANDTLRWEGTIRAAYQQGPMQVWLTTERRLLIPFLWLAAPSSPYYPAGVGFSGAVPSQRAQAAFRWRGLSLAGSIGRVGTFPQWDTALHLVVRPVARWYQVRAKVQGRSRRWDGTAEIIAQQADSGWWGVSPLVIKAWGAVKWRWLRRVESAFRLRVFWHAPYTAPRFYAPRLSWLWPTGERIANPPWIQAELTGRVKTFEAFVRASHLRFLLTGEPFLIDNYNPSSPFRLTWGIQWTFND